MQVEQHSAERPSLRVGIVGCGHVARHHLQAVRETAGARVVGLVDADAEASRRLGEDFGVESTHGSLDALLGSTAVDVVHVLTPPQYHHAQALEALRGGAHVLLEKPCTLAAADLERLYGVAEEAGLAICPDFLQLYHPLFRRLASWVESERYGRVVHVESCMSPALDLAQLTAGPEPHWSFRLPGGVLHNFISHPLYLALHFLGPPRDVRVAAKSRGTLPRGLTDHLSIALEGEDATGSVLLSTALGTSPYYVRVYCEDAVLVFDLFSSSLTVSGGGSIPRFVRRATTGFEQARQLTASAVGNVLKVLTGRLKAYQGLGALIGRFYDGIRDGGEAPVSKQLALAVTRTEETVFASAGRWRPEPAPRRAAPRRADPGTTVLVTGATGYVGRHVVRRLVADGYEVRALVRPLSRVERLPEDGVETVEGDVRDAKAFLEAAQGAEVLVHLAAATRGDAESIRASAVGGARNAADVVRRAGLSRVIYMSSMSVYDYVRLGDGETLSEDGPLEAEPQLRGAYSAAKREAEDVALAELERDGPLWTVLRPSFIVGGERDLTAPAGRRIGGTLLCLGSPRKHLRLVHVDDVAQAVSRSIGEPATGGRVFHLTDPAPVTLKEYVKRCVRSSAGGPKRVVYVPRWLAAAAFGALRLVRRLTGRPGLPARRRLAYVYTDPRVSSARFEAATGWRPAGDLLERLRQDS